MPELLKCIAVPELAVDQATRSSYTLTSLTFVDAPKLVRGLAALTVIINSSGGTYTVHWISCIALPECITLPESTLCGMPLLKYK